MAFDPTPEQAACVDAFRRHDGDLAITAGAGAGKTSTLKLLAGVFPNARGVYLAYNRAIAAEAQASFPGRVTAKTAHALAFAAVGRQYAHRLNARRITGREQAAILGINGPHRVSDDKVLAPAQVARITMETIAKFCYSNDPEPGRHHVPRDIPGVVDGGMEAQRRLEQIIEPFAKKAWADLVRTDGKLRFSHDCYLKIWALSEPVIDADYLMLDEAQDTNPCVAGIFDAQNHLLRIAVGDPNQAIYGWRGATDHMSRMDAKYRLTLSQSFRFGQEIADEANKWLTILDTDLRITGYGHSEVRPLTETPDAVLCRTNAEAVATLIRAHDAGVKAGLVGGGKELVDFANAVDNLTRDGWTSHPELAGFVTWNQVVDYVENDHGGEDFAVAVKLIETYGTDGIRNAIEGAADEGAADMVISTAHKSKGREWNRVRIADDFPEPKATEHGLGRIPRADAMLAYVAVTRAKRILDRDGLAFVDKYLLTAGRNPDGRGTSLPSPGRPAPAPVPLAAPTAARNVAAGPVVDLPIEPDANFLYTVTVDGAVVAETTNYTAAARVRDARPGSTLDGKARKPLEAVYA